MGRFQSWRLIMLALALSAVLIAGCGARGTTAGSGGGSGADPAAIAPAGAIAYVDIAVRPQGALSRQVEAGLTKVLGFSPDGPLQSLAGHLLAKIGTSYAAGVRPWLGQRVALVATELSPSGLAAIAPTADPTAATAFISRLLHKLGGSVQSTTVAGSSFQQASVGAFTLVGGTVDGDAVIGGRSAVAAIVNSAHTGSLAHVSQFADAMAAAPAGSVVRAYLQLKPLLSGVFALPLAGVGLGSAGIGGAELSRAQAQLAKLPANAAGFLDVAVDPSRVQLDLRTLGARRPSGPPSPGVGSLPASTWLGIDTGGRPISAAILQQVKRSLAGGFGSALPLSLVNRELGFDVTDLVGLFGPLKLAVSGTTLESAAVGLALRPASPADATRVLGSLERHLHTVGQTSSTGSGMFVFTRANLLGHVLTVLRSGSDVLARFGPGAAAPSALAPSNGTLAGTAAFQQAVAALPSGARAVLYVNASQLAALVRSSPKASTRTDRKVEAIISRFSYLIAGGGRGAIRVVLGLN